MNALGEILLSPAEVQTVEAQVDRKIRLARRIAGAVLISGAAMTGAGIGGSFLSDLSYSLKSLSNTHYIYATSNNEVISPPENHGAEELIYGGVLATLVGSVAYGRVWLWGREIERDLIQNKLDALQPEDILQPKE